MDEFVRLPKKGLPSDEILREMDTFREHDARWKEGKTWSLVYYLNEAHTDFLKQAYGKYFSENALNPLAFQSLKRFETEVVQMTASMLHGDREVVGTMTAGGTESVMLAVKAYRDRARARHKGLKQPEMILPESAHVAFIKAAHYFDVKPVFVPLTKDFTVDPAEMEKRINPRTALLVVSAPNYPYGTIDPVADVGRIALKHGLPLHVDACLGGFLLPFLEKSGYAVPPFDFRVPGVTSISADVHKYGYAAKGASVILYKNMDYLKHQFFVYADWAGGVFASSGLLGTRPGGSIAAAWAAMKVMGEEGYTEQARKAMDVTVRIKKGIEKIPELDILGNPPATVLRFVSNDRDVDIYAVGDVMEKYGWHIDRQLKPESLHIMVTPSHARVADFYVRDLAEAITYVRNHPNARYDGGAALYGMIAAIPLRKMVHKNVLKMLEDMYGSESVIPNFEEEQKPDLSTRLGTLYLKLRHALRKYIGKM